MHKRLLTIGYYDPESPRYQNLCTDLKKRGYEPIQCRTTARGFFRKIWDLHKKYQQLAKLGDDVLICFPGHYLVPIFWWLTRFPRRTLLFDAFISLSDTLVSDRKQLSWWHPQAWFLYLVDYAACLLADEIFIDTEAHKQFFAKHFFVPRKKITVSYVGTRHDLFTPGKKTDALPQDKFNVLFIGTYIPLQGIEHIVEAARIVHDEKHIHFTLIGSGQTKPEIAEQIANLELTNVTLLDFQPIETLPNYLRSCDVALGIFGTTDKADRVIPHKVFDAVGCNVPVITAQNQAIEEVFTDGKEVYLVPPGDGQVIATAIKKLAN